MDCPKLFVRTTGDKAICIRLIKKEPTTIRCVTPPPIETETTDSLPTTSNTVQNSSPDDLDSNFVQHAIEIEQDQLCVFSGNEPMKSDVIYDEDYVNEASNDSPCMFSLQNMQIRYDGDTCNETNDENFKYDDSLLIRAADMLPSTSGDVVNSACNVIPLIPADEESTTKPKRNKDRWKQKNPQSVKKIQKIFRKVVERFVTAKEREIESIDEKDPFNLSNDQYYKPLVPNVVDCETVMLHSLPAHDLTPPLFPTHFTIEQLQNFHRWPLSRQNFIAKHFSKKNFQSVLSLEKHIEKVAKLREEHRLESGGGAMFFMRQMEDLTGKDGDLILCEYSEEHPPLIMQPGMTTRMKNLYKKVQGQNSMSSIEPHFDYGETTFVKTSPLLGNINVDEVVQILENNLFRAPIFLHDFPETDFLIVRDANGYYIRSISNIYCVGQECPVYEVPAPNSQKASAFTRDFLLAYIYRLFWESQEKNPRRLKSEVLRQAFPQYAESSIRKRLKSCSVFARLGPGVEWNYWLMHDDFRLPSLEQIREMVTPEMYCAYFCMRAAEQRLKDAGYGDKYFLTVEDNQDDDVDDEANEQNKLTDEIKCAPWNTTRAFLTAMRGKCLLDLTGVADPTGRGEGFSYVKVPAKAIPSSNAARPSYFYCGNNKLSNVESLFGDAPPSTAKLKRCINGTDADLRKLSLNDARDLLKDLGVKEREIRALKRWEVIDVIRTFSTHQARSGELGLTKFARGSLRLSSNEVQERYKQECQRIFELQNRILSCAEYMSTDDEEDESDVEEIEVREVPHSRIKSDVKMEPNDDDYDDHRCSSAGRNSTPMTTTNDERKLKIYRSYRSVDGREYINVEVVSQSELIDAYLKVRTSKDEGFITKFAQEDKQYKIEKRKEKRRLQDKLRRIKRNQLKAQLGLPVGRVKQPLKPPKPIKASLLKMRCSACGGNGHMKTNKHCPFYKRTLNETSSSADVNSTTNENNDADADDDMESENYVSLEGTKLKIRRNPVRPNARRKFDSDEYNSDSLSSNDEEPAVSETVDTPSENDEDVKDRPKKHINRRRTDPKVELCNLFEKIIDEIKSTDVATPFLKPVSRKSYPDYFTIVSRPMDLSTIKVNLSKIRYANRQRFVDDVQQILTNARRYNGDEHDVTLAAEKLVASALEKLASQEKKVKNFERLIDPLVGDDDETSFCRELRRIVEKCLLLPKVVQLNVPEKKFKIYFDTIVEPIDLNEIKSKCTSKQYRRVDDFMSDVDRIHRNSEIFNGSTSAITAKAKEIVDLTKTLISQNSDRLAWLERRLMGFIKEEQGAFFEQPVVVDATMTTSMKYSNEMSEMDRRLGNFLPDSRRFNAEEMRIKEENETAAASNGYDVPLDISEDIDAKVDEPPPLKEPVRKRRRLAIRKH